jgi:protein farnesyltransferase subunit beta
MKDPSGGFTVTPSGEIDTRGTYCAVAVASVLNLLTPELTKGTAEWIASCQRYEGGIAGEPGSEAHGGYTYCGLASLIMLHSTHLLDMPKLLKWATQRQMPLEGGFQGRTNKLVDGCYSFWVGALFPLVDLLLARPAEKQDSKAMMERDWLFDQHALQRYLLACCQPPRGGGLRDKPGKHQDLYHTCYCLAGLSAAQNTLVSGSDVVGHPENLLRMTNPLYNVEPARMQQALLYFAKLPNLSKADKQSSETKTSASLDSSSDKQSKHVTASQQQQTLLDSRLQTQSTSNVGSTSVSAQSTAAKQSLTLETTVVSDKAADRR